MTVYWIGIGVRVLLALGMLLGGRSYEFQARDSIYWPQVDFQLERCEIVEGIESEPNSWCKSYDLQVSYTYEYRGEPFRSHQVTHFYSGNEGRRREFCEDLLEKVQQATCVYVNPANPKQAVLIPGDELRPRISLGLRSVLAGAFFVAAVAGWTAICFLFLGR